MTSDTTAQLAERDQAILDFERTWWQRSDGSSKRAGIAKELHISSTSYYTTLDRLVDCDAAQAYDPLVVARLRRRRVERRRAQFESNVAHQHP